MPAARPAAPAPLAPGAGDGSAVVRETGVPPAIVILGADALLAARPATPAQLANACLAGGYSAAVPASWGDELIAAAALERLAGRGDRPVVLCSCPRVVERLRRVPALGDTMLPFVAPAVAAARYLRARAGVAGLSITYIGDCPGAVDPSIDRVATPAALLRSLARRGIVVGEQPLEVDPRAARDGRRFYSVPGGAPAPNWILAERRGDHVIEPEAVDYVAEIAHRASARDRTVIDLAPRLGCACSGSIPGTPWPSARAAVIAIEPPRAVHEILDHDMPVDVGYVPAPWPGSASTGVQTDPTTLHVLAAQHAADPPAPSERAGAPRGGGGAVPVGPAPTQSAHPGWGGPDRRRWDGIERRRGWVNGRPAGWIDPAPATVSAIAAPAMVRPALATPAIPATGSAPPAVVGGAARTSAATRSEPRTGPLREQHTFIRVPAPPIERRRMVGIAVASSAIVAVATTVLTLHFVFGVHPAVSIPRLSGRSAMGRAGMPVASSGGHDSVGRHDTVAVRPAAEAEPSPSTPEVEPITDAPPSAPPRADPVVADALPAAPIAPPDAPAARRTAARHVNRRPPGVDGAPADPATRATVVAPGAAPIPSASTPEPVAPAATFPTAPLKRGALTASSPAPTPP